MKLNDCVTAFILSALLVVGSMGCSAITPEMVRELAKDDASICISTDVRGGAGGIVGGATGGYGQASLALCRSGKDNATISMSPDGTMSIHNGAAE